jgi:hypothetical protein
LAERQQRAEQGQTHVKSDPKAERVLVGIGFDMVAKDDTAEIAAQKKLTDYQYLLETVQPQDTLFIYNENVEQWQVPEDYRPGDANGIAAPGRTGSKGRASFKTDELAQAAEAQFSSGAARDP